MRLLTAPKPTAKIAPPARVIITWMKFALSGVIIGIIINRKAPTPQESNMDIQVRCFATTEKAKNIATNTATRKILENKQATIPPALKPTISNGSPAIAPPNIAPIKYIRIIIAPPAKQTSVFEIT